MLFGMARGVYSTVQTDQSPGCFSGLNSLGNTLLGLYGTLPLTQPLSWIFFFLNIVFIGIGTFFTTMGCLAEFPTSDISFIELSTDEVLAYFPDVEQSVVSTVLAYLVIALSAYGTFGNFVGGNYYYWGLAVANFITGIVMIFI
mmetsp:Transcript_44850/g.43440  ORF Transcript_44850/g.43440 Transcript_44850/m.43440 type:complete len:144 (-) Transcript_44850:40-471(-)